MRGGGVVNAEPRMHAEGSAPGYFIVALGVFLFLYDASSLYLISAFSLPLMYMRMGGVRLSKRKKQNSEIAYQNKDIVSTLMAEEFKGKTFAVYGIDVPEIVEAKPTNLPAIEADELRLDNLFLLADGSYAIVDYESKYREKNCVDYLNRVKIMSVDKK